MPDRFSGAMDVQARVPTRPVLPCAQCGATLFAPEWSEHVDERRIRHLWVCRACDYCFESIVVYPASERHAA